MALTLASRQSPLAQIQVKEVMAAFPGTAYDVLFSETTGDRRRDVSLLTNTEDDFFTRELDQMVLSGRADAAVHSAKDLPIPLPDGLVAAALTGGKNPADCLVSRDRRGLKELPAGARVGTSSPARQKQLEELRPDIVPVGVRGTVEERLRLIDDGKIDALIVAFCALERLGLAGRSAELLPFSSHPLQGKLAVVCRWDRADIRGLFHSLDVRRGYGRVTLAGAGPGAADLLTVRARRVLEQADVVYYDDLIGDDVLFLTTATCRYVGNRKGGWRTEHALLQEQMYQAVREGKRVVRLKGGDPSLFARTGEDVEFFRRRLLPVEIVPGVTAASAGAAAAGFALTRRGTSRKAVFLTGHTKDDSAGDHPGTHVYYMAASRPAEVAGDLLRRGHGPESPVVIVRNAGRYDETALLTTVKDLPRAQVPSPVILLAGQVAWAARVEKKILFTGLDPDALELPGAPVHQPLIEIAPVEPPALRMGDYDAVLFTSRSAVDAFLARYSTEGKTVLAVGPVTASRLMVHGITDIIVTPDENAEGLARLLKGSRHRAVLYPCSNLSDNVLHRLEQVHPVVFYETRKCRPAPLDLSYFNGVAFTSPSAVEAFWDVYGPPPPHVLLHVPGTTTAGALLARGVDPLRIVKERNRVPKVPPTASGRRNPPPTPGNISN